MSNHWFKTRRISRQKSHQRHWWSFDYLSGRRLFPALQHSISHFEGTVLDLGCGNQPYRAWFEAHNLKVVGYDPDWEDSTPNIVGIGQRLPFGTAQFDGVFSAQTLEHVPEPWTVFDEIARVLKPGGYVVLSAPQAWRVHEAPHDYFRYTKYGLRSLAERSGLEVKSVTPLSTVWSVLGQGFLNIIPHNRLFGLTAPFNLMVNLIFVPLDSVWLGQKDTLDNLLIAKKPYQP